MAPACAAASPRPRTVEAATTTLASARIPRSADRTSTLGKGSPDCFSDRLARIGAPARLRRVVACRAHRAFMAEDEGNGSLGGQPTNPVALFSRRRCYGLDPCAGGIPVLPGVADQRRQAG